MTRADRYRAYMVILIGIFSLVQIVFIDKQYRWYYLGIFGMIFPAIHKFRCFTNHYLCRSTKRQWANNVFPAYITAQCGNCIATTCAHP